MGEGREAPQRSVAIPGLWQDPVLAGEQEDGLAAMVEIVLTALKHELPVLLDDPDLLAAARSGMAADIAVALDLTAGTLSLSDLEPTPQATAFARQLARRNLPVADLNRAYRVAVRALWYWAAGQIRQRVHDPSERADAIEGLSKAVFATGDALGEMVMKRYADERERWLRSADAVRSATVQELLGGDPVDLHTASQRVRYELRQEHQAFVVWSEEEGIHPEGAAAAVGGSRALLVPMGVGIVAGWSPAGTSDPSAAEGVAVALGVPGRDLAGFRASHHEAMAARRVARLMGRRESPIYYDDVALLALLTTDLEQAANFARRRLGPLAAQDVATRRLADTLLTVLEANRSPRRAALLLGVHENTVAKRLRTIDEMMEPTEHDSPVELMAALQISRALHAEHRVAAATCAATADRLPKAGGRGGPLAAAERATAPNRSA